jgi:hypothetical protein
MDYHLSRDGNELGIFPLEELHRRRVAGELTGAEFVWCKGMAQWEPLDGVLQQQRPPGVRPVWSAPPAKPKVSPFLLVLAAVMLLVCLCGLVFIGGTAVKRARRLPEALGLFDQARESGPSGASPLALVSQPILWKSNAVTAAEVKVRGSEFRVRQYLQGYQLRGERAPGCDELCQGFLENWLAANFGGALHTNLPPLPELSDQLAANPDCRDPLVLAVSALLCGDLHEQGQRYERAVQGFESSKHLAYPKFFATVSLADNLVQLQSQYARVARLDALALQRLREAFEDGSLRPGDQAELGEIFLNGYGAQFFNRSHARVTTLVKERGEDFKWLALVLEGESEINEAWRLRGNGYANTVTTQGWQGFTAQLTLADRALTQAWRLHPELPLAPSRMITVSLGRAGLPEMRLWFDRTLAAQVDYAPAWKELRWGLRPRWFGDQESMLAFGITAVNTRHFETEVPWQLMASINDLEAELKPPAGTHLYGREDIWPHVQEMYEGYLAEPARPASLKFWRGHYAAVAYLAGKYSVAGGQLQGLDGRPDYANLSGWGVDMSVMPLEVAARTGPQAAIVAAAEAGRDRGDSAAALKEYRQLAADETLDAGTLAFARDRVATLELEARLQTGQWVDFLPADTNFTGWFIEQGECHLNPDHSLEVRSGESGHLLFCRARLGREFEVRGQIEAVQTSNRAFQGGLVMGLPQLTDNNWYSFRIKRNPVEGDIASFARHWTKPESVGHLIQAGLTNTFEFRYQNGRAGATVDGQPVLTDVPPPAQINVAADEFYLGLGAFNDQNHTTIRYRDVQVRLLPPPATQTLKSNVGRIVTEDSDGIRPQQYDIQR